MITHRRELSVHWRADHQDQVLRNFLEILVFSWIFVGSKKTVSRETPVGARLSASGMEDRSSSVKTSVKYSFRREAISLLEDKTWPLSLSGPTVDLPFVTDLRCA